MKDNNISQVLGVKLLSKIFIREKKLHNLRFGKHTAKSGLLNACGTSQCILKYL